MKEFSSVMFKYIVISYESVLPDTYKNGHDLGTLE